MDSSQPTKQLRVAFIGGAYDSAVGRAHRTAIEMDQRFTLVSGVFSRDTERNHSSACKYGLPQEAAISSLDELIMARDSFDVAVVLTPQANHLDHVQACLETKIPVICEKALAANSAEALSIKQSITSSNGYLAVTYNYTGYPMVRELKQLIEGGFLGTLHQIHLQMPQESFLKKSLSGDAILPQEWRLTDGLIPTLSLDLGIHLHMMSRFLTDSTPTEVVSASNTHGNFKDIIDTVSCLVRYSNGMDGVISYSKTALGNRNGLKVEVFGSKGAATWIQSRPEELSFSDDKGNSSTLDRGSPHITVASQERYQRFKAGHPAGFIEAFANYYRDIHCSLTDHIQGKARVPNKFVFGIEESIEGLRFLEAVALSSKTRMWEKI